LQAQSYQRVEPPIKSHSEADILLHSPSNGLGDTNRIELAPLLAK